jgi:outer membrane protein assembly factor BamA
LNRKNQTEYQLMPKTNRQYLKFKPAIFLLILLFSSQASSQDSSMTIQNIVIMGNDVTDDNVILRELLIHLGDPPDESKLLESRRRLMNLYLFNRVEFKLYPQDEKSLILLIEVTEKIYFYPLPILTIQERDWSKWSYGLSAVHTNFRGQNERLWVGFWFGYRPGFGLRFSDQWAGDSLHLNTGFSITKNTITHRTIPDMEEGHITGSIMLGKWWGYHFNTAFTFHYDRIEVEPQFKYLMQSGHTIEHTFGLELALRHDTRDLYFFPSNGWFNNLKLFQYGFFENYNHYNRVELDLRNYQKVGPIILAGRFYQNSLFGDVPVYRMNYLGYSERIRGHFYYTAEGRHVQILSAETRFNILPVQYFSLNLPPIPQQYLHNLKFGVSTSLFIDTGSIWNNSFEHHINNYKTGFGFGILFHLPYVEIFRIDCGFNREWESQLIFEVGVVF